MRKIKMFGFIMQQNFKDRELGDQHRIERVKVVPQ